MVITKFLDPKNNLAFKRIFGTERNKVILIRFLNDVLCLAEEHKIRDVTFQPTVQDPYTSSKKQSIVDVLCTDEIGNQIIVEMQVSPQEQFEKRAQYYAAKAYSSQLNKGQEKGGRYKDLKAVIFIAICDKTIFKGDQVYLRRHIILNEATHKQELKDFSFTFIELSKFKIREIKNLKTLVEKWCHFFKYAPYTGEQEVAELISKDPILGKAYEELNQFNWSDIELDTYEKEQKRVMDNEAAEDYVRTEGLEMGRKEGLSEGLKKGKQEGRKEGLSEGLKQGKQEGRKEGLSEGLEKGKQEGRKEGLSEGLEKGKQEGLSEGLEKGKLAIARNMLKEGIDSQTIQKVTSLTKEMIESLSP